MRWCSHFYCGLLHLKQAVLAPFLLLLLSQLSSDWLSPAHYFHLAYIVITLLFATLTS